MALSQELTKAGWSRRETGLLMAGKRLLLCIGGQEGDQKRCQAGEWVGRRLLWQLLLLSHVQHVAALQALHKNGEP